MRRLKTNEVFSNESLNYVNEYGAKAGLLRFVKEKNQKLANKILDGHHVPFCDVNRDNLESFFTSNGSKSVIIRSTHPDDGVGFIGRLPTIEKVSNISAFESVSYNSGDFFFRREKDMLTGYCERFQYSPVNKTGLYLQDTIGEEGVVFGNIVEHPNKKGVYIISGRNGKYGFAGQSYVDENETAKSSRRQKEFYLEIPLKKELITAFKEARETGFLNDGISGQMEFAVTKEGHIQILQFRAFREKEYSDWVLDDPDLSSRHNLVFGVTPQEGLDIEIADMNTYDLLINQLSLEIGDIGNALYRPNYKLTIPADFRFEELIASISNGSVAAFEHDASELASNVEISILRSDTKSSTLDILGSNNTSKCKIYSDGSNYKIVKQ